MTFSYKKIVAWVTRVVVLILLFTPASLSIPAYPSPAQAQESINILDYIMATTGNNMSSGEYFWVDGGPGEFKMCKNSGCSEFQKFRSDGSYIYHVEDVTWARGLNDNITCNNGNEAFYRVYEGYGYNCENLPATAGGRWAPINMSVGDSFSAQYSIVGFDEEVYRRSGTLSCCDTPYAGDLPHSITLRFYGCVVFSTGAELDDVIILSGQGANAENYYYDNEYGWVGFDIGGVSSGSYIADPIDEVEDTSQCVQAKASSKSGLTPGTASYDWPEDPGHFYVLKDGQEGLIERVKTAALASSLPSPPGSPGSPGEWTPPPPPPTPPANPEGILDIPAYLQTDYRWRAEELDVCDPPEYIGQPNEGSGCTIGTGCGCGPTSLAMIMAYFEIRKEGHLINPGDIGPYLSHPNEYRCGRGGVMNGLARWSNLPYTSIDSSELQFFLRNGHPVLALCRKWGIGYGTGGWSHFSVIKGYEDGYIYFQDPIVGEAIFPADAVFSEETIDFQCNYLYAFGD